MVHFITKCKNLEIKIDYNIIDKSISNLEERMRILLYRNENHQEVGRLVKNLWTLRKELINNLVTEPNKNPSLSRLVTEQDINPSLSGPVTGQGKIHH